MSVKFSAVDFGPEAHANVRRLQLEWFDRWLRDVPQRDEPAPPLRIFVMGVNQWRNEAEWPLARTVYRPFYFDTKGVLRESVPRRSEPDRYAYDPHRPVPTAGGPVCCNPKLFPYGPMDQRAVENRADVLVYTSAPLKQDLEVTGPVRAILSVSTDAPDTDFTAKLVDVEPSGRALNLCDGILRLRYRDSIEKTAPAALPGEVYRVTVDAGITSNVFRAGHRIRVEISSSNFPRFDRNPNTGRPVAEESQLRIAHQTVYHDQKRPSYILLPVIPAQRAAR
jgi:putative CocE/NonD family hydrolase